MGGIEVRHHHAAVAGHHPQVVQLIARGGDDGMKTRADHGDVVVADEEGLLGAVAVELVADLDAEPARRVGLEQVDLLQVDLLGRVVAVVAVRGIGGPVARGVDRLAQQQALRVVLGAEDRADRARPVALADLSDPLLGGGDDARGRGVGGGLGGPVRPRRLRTRCGTTA